MARRNLTVQAAVEGEPGVTYRKPDELLHHLSPDNPNVQDTDTYKALVVSVRRFGMVEPVVFNTNTRRVVGGEHRVRAAAEAGLEWVPCCDVNLDDVRERELALALNRIRGRFDRSKLAGVLASMRTTDADLAVTGFRPGELDKLFKDGRADQAKRNRDLPRGDAGPFQSMQVTLHDDQAQLVAEALRLAGEQGAYTNTRNRNAQGNAVHRMAAVYCELVASNPDLSAHIHDKVERDAGGVD